MRIIPKHRNSICIFQICTFSDRMDLSMEINRFLLTNLLGITSLKGVSLDVRILSDAKDFSLAIVDNCRDIDLTAHT